jgi:hypothetical protein
MKKSSQLKEKKLKPMYLLHLVFCLKLVWLLGRRESKVLGMAIVISVISDKLIAYLNISH